jgi:hypothetical protein
MRSLIHANGPVAEIRRAVSPNVFDAVPARCHYGVITWVRAALTIADRVLVAPMIGTRGAGNSEIAIAHGGPE